jgi:hypothetical protein
MKKVDMDEVRVIMKKIITRQTRDKKFPGYDQADIEQEVWIIALKSMGKYNVDRGNLENFLSVCVNNGLRNLHRDKYFRTEKPCVSCEFFDKDKKECTIFTKDDKMECKKWARYKRNTWSKINLHNPVPISNVTVHIDPMSKGVIEAYDVIKCVDDKLGSGLAIDLLLTMSGHKMSIPLHKRNQLKALIGELDIL